MTMTLGLFVSLMLFWVALSGRLEPLPIAMGVLSAGIVTWLTRDLVDVALGHQSRGRHLGRRLWRAVAYLVWLVGRIAVASIQVAYYVVHPRLPLRPGVLRFRTTLQSPVARTVLANSITLVPGTLTLQLDDGEYVVHALVPAAADDLATGRMQTMIGRVFLEGPEPAPVVSWEERECP